MLLTSRGDWLKLNWDIVIISFGCCYVILLNTNKKLVSKKKLLKNVHQCLHDKFLVQKSNITKNFIKSGRLWWIIFSDFKPLN